MPGTRNNPCTRSPYHPIRRSGKVRDLVRRRTGWFCGGKSVSVEVELEADHSSSGQDDDFLTGYMLRWTISLGIKAEWRIDTV